MTENYEKLSKDCSYVLRHQPEKYGLKVDVEGWVDLSKFINVLNSEFKWQSLTITDIERMISKSRKQRHEILNGEIRALYGHSLSQKITKTACEPPEFLYHGTARRSLGSIFDKGLLAQQRQYIHLSDDITTAYQVGKRYDDEPVILKIDAKTAWLSGIQFYQGHDSIWLSDPINPNYIEVLEK